MNNILEVRNLCKKYGAADGFSLKDISFNVPYGCIMGFIGPNGAGKTTTIKSILNVIKTDSGNINLFGRENAVLHNEHIGIVMDAPLYVDDWTLKDTERAISPFYSNWDTKKYADYLGRFSIDPKKKVKDLSRGMKVKLQIASALSHNAKLLILDEPTSGLDPAARDEICDLLRGFICDEEHGVLFSTHITADLEKTADYITFILNGNIVFTGAKDALLEKYARITGGLNDLNSGQKKLVIGYREHTTGFEGMIETANTGAFPPDSVIEQTTLDEIIIFMNQGAKINE